MQKNRFLWLLPVFLFVSLACSLAGAPAPTAAPTLPLPTQTAAAPAVTPTTAPDPTQPPPAETAATVPPAATTIPTSAPPAGGETRRVLIYMVALEDGGASGQAIGCGDSLVPVNQDVPAVAEPIRAALEALLAQKGQYFGGSGLYNSLYNSALQVDSVQVDASGHASVALSGEFLLGGVCDNPRFQAQIEETVRQFPEVQSVEVTINGTPLEDLLSGRGT
jgi:hypothetical protein